MSGTVVRAAIGVAALMAAIGTAAPAAAQGQGSTNQGRLDARYSVTLAGLPVGKGAWVIDLSDNQYTAAASGAAAGMLRVFSSGQGSGASRGFIVGGNPVPQSFAATITSNKKTEEIRMTLASGDVKEFAVTPEQPEEPDRIPVTEAHTRGVSDPMTGSLFRVPGTGNPVGPQACQRTTPIFDGRMRYNLQFAFKRMDQVKAEKGYEGPVVVCSVYFTPLAGYVPHRAAIKYLMAQRDMEVWFAPVGNTRVLVPYKVLIPTPLGNGVMEATQFVSVSSAPPPHATATGVRTQ